MFEGYGGATRILPIVGDPIAQVKAPAGLSRAFRAAGFDRLVVPFQVAPADIAGFFAAMDRAANVDGLLATVPHKFAALRHAATASDRARRLGAANVLRRKPAGWHADMLDGLAFVRAIERAGFRPAGKRGLLVGAGGAGSAIGLELLNAGLAKLAIHDSDAERAVALAARLAAAYPGRVAIGSADPSGHDLIVNATPAGMRADDPLPVQGDKLRPGMFVGEVITLPEVTPLLAAARALGCATATGVDMFEASIALMLAFFTAGD
ncbi:MAG: shikimate dehydrogenase [Alphaproteobacteria bacterium]|nr:shikimate dehydrogenase [Alphaproteobacteria bacterium]